MSTWEHSLLCHKTCHASRVHDKVQVTFTLGKKHLSWDEQCLFALNHTVSILCYIFHSFGKVSSWIVLGTTRPLATYMWREIFPCRGQRWVTGTVARYVMNSYTKTQTSLVYPAEHVEALVIRIKPFAFAAYQEQCCWLKHIVIEQVSDRLYLLQFHTH